MPETTLNRQPDISIVVVNFNVKEYVANLFASLYRAAEGLNLEIFLIDNSTVEGSIPFLQERYPNVHYIRNTKNVGFGKANNMAIRQAKGRYTLIINPDTIVSEDTLQLCFSYMSKHPECGALGCKILNADGSYAPESKRSFPSVWNAFCKASGLTSIFPDSKLFARYYCNDVAHDQTGKVPVLSGAFIFFETSLLQQLDGFDERFFMYGEDIDLCKRVHQQGKHIVYLPQTTIVHYKGESAKHNDIGYIKAFNQALFLYFEKHVSKGWARFFKGSVRIAVWLKILMGFLSLFWNRLRALVFDLLIINITMVIGYLLRYEIGVDQLFTEWPYIRFWWTNLTVSVSYAALSPRFELLDKARYGVIARVKTLFFSYLILAVLSFFIKDIAFSRLILGSSALVNILLFILFYTYRKSTAKSAEQVPGRLGTTRLLIAGYDQEQTADLIRKIRQQPGWNYELLGVVVQFGRTNVPSDIESIPVIGQVNQLNDLIKAYRVDQVHYLMKAFRYKDMLQLMAEIGKSGKVIQKIVPDSLEYILGKSNVEYLENVAIIDVDLPYFRGLNPVAKRLLDVFGWVFLRIWSMKIKDLEPLTTAEIKTVVLDTENNFTLKLNFPLQYYPKSNLKLLLVALKKGQLSLVGAPIAHRSKAEGLHYTCGLTGLSQINPNVGLKAEDISRFDLYYLQHYSIWLDLDIIVKTFLRKPDLFLQIAKTMPD